MSAKRPRRQIEGISSKAGGRTVERAGKECNSHLQLHCFQHHKHVALAHLLPGLSEDLS